MKCWVLFCDSTLKIQERIHTIFEKKFKICNTWYTVEGFSWMSLLNSFTEHVVVWWFISFTESEQNQYCVAVERQFIQVRVTQLLTELLDAMVFCDCLLSQKGCVNKSPCWQQGAGQSIDTAWEQHCGHLREDISLRSTWGLRINVSTESYYSYYYYFCKYSYFTVHFNVKTDTP